MKDKIFDLIKKEKRRQEENINLIASENYASPAVLAALGSVLTNKYSEGYSRKRYYEGQKYIDQVEELAIERAKKLFGAEHANVQPYSGSPANIAVYYALLSPGDKIMGMRLPHGGHLTHGHVVSASSRFYKSVQYGVSKKTKLLDYDEIRKIAEKEKPKIIVCGYTAYPREIDFKKFSDIAKEIGAYLLADISHIAGLVAAGVHQSPVPYADVVTTTTHKTLRGPRGAIILCKKEYADLIDKAVFPGLQGGPHDHQTAAIAVCLEEAAKPEFKKYGQQIVKNAKALAKELANLGYDLISGGTDNHLMLVDFTKKKISGKEAAEALEEAGIVVNKNTVPFDKNPPANPSGVRLGTPSVTTRGMKEREMKQIAQLIDKVLKNVGDKKVLKEVSREVKELCKRFPVYTQN